MNWCCGCIETWTPLPMCEGETQQRYAYGLWVSPDCEQHHAHLTGMQEMIKEVHDGLV